MTMKPYGASQSHRMTNAVSPRPGETAAACLALQGTSQNELLETLGAFLVAGLYLAALPIELFLGTRVPFPFIVYTIATTCFVLLMRWRRVEDMFLALFGRSTRSSAMLLLLVGALVFWFALQAFVSPCPGYAQRKYPLWIINGILPLIVGYLWIDAPAGIGKLLRAGWIWAALVLVFWLFNPDAAASLDARHIVLRGEFSELTSCSFCRSVIMAAMVCVVSVGLRVFRWPAAVIPAGFVPALLFLGLQSGSRGAVLSFGAAVSFFLVFSLSRRRLLLLGVCLAVLAAMTFTHIATTNSMSGIIDSGLLQGDVRDGSVLEHFAAWRLSTAAAVRNPLGIGFGGYPHIAGYGDEPLYPHNTVLEVWVESGWVGLGLYACLIATPFIRLGRKAFADKRMVALTSLFLLTFLFAQTYLGIEGNNPYWFFLGALWSIAAPVPQPVTANPRRDGATMELVRILGRKHPAMRSGGLASTNNCGEGRILRAVR